jgi:hypothetical protein
MLPSNQSAFGGSHYTCCSIFGSRHTQTRIGEHALVETWGGYLGKSLARSESYRFAGDYPCQNGSIRKQEPASRFEDPPDFTKRLASVLCMQDDIERDHCIKGIVRKGQELIEIPLPKIHPILNSTLAGRNPPRMERSVADF